MSWYTFLEKIVNQEGYVYSGLKSITIGSLVVFAPPAFLASCHLCNQNSVLSNKIEIYKLNVKYLGIS